MSTRLLTAAFAAAILSMASSCKDTKKSTNEAAGKAIDIDIGAALFAPAPYPEATTATPGDEPVTIPMANVVVLRKLDLPSAVDGTVKWIGKEIDEAAAAQLLAADVFRNPRDKKVYRRMVVGDEVERRDQVIGFLEDEAPFLEYKAAVAKADAAKKSAAAYVVTVETLKKIVDKTADGVRKGIVPEQELLNSQATQARYEADLVDHQGSAEVAVAQAAQAKDAWEKRILKAAVGGEVQQVLKHAGEGVKAQEPVLVIQGFATLRAIGPLPKEYVNSVARGDDVTIEVPRDVPPGVAFEQHTTNKPIVAVAVAVVDGKPVVVSAAEDGWVYVWDRDLKVLGSWRVSGGVRSLAVTRPGVKPALALVGGLNGTAGVYDLANPKAEPRTFEGKHEGGVTAAAFSPNGQFCVTSDERGIAMYKVADGKKMYAFPAREHHSPVTALHFTPEGKVVSVGREPSVRVWTVGDKAAKVEHRIDSRSGDVTSPGVTDDGSRLLLDADKTHLDVIHLKDLRKERPLVTAGEAARFTTFTAWSPELDKKPDNRLVATTGGNEGVVQLWRAPTGANRPAEIARLVTRGGAAATCASFNPLADNGFLVVGTKKGDVHLWSLPTGTDVQAEVKSAVTYVDPAIESSGRTVNVLVDFTNPKAGDKYLLRPGSAVTLVIRPKK